MPRQAPELKANQKTAIERGFNPLSGRSLLTGEKTSLSQTEVDMESQRKQAVLQAEARVAKRKAEGEAAAAKAKRELEAAEAQLEKALRLVASETVDEIQEGDEKPKKKKAKKYK